MSLFLWMNVWWRDEVVQSTSSKKYRCTLPFLVLDEQKGRKDATEGVPPLTLLIFTSR